MRLTKEIAIRIMADIMLINLAALTASTALQLLPFWGGVYALDVYRACAPMLTVICPVVFYLTGLYTYGRAYRVRYKALTIFRAVTISYLVVAILAFAVNLLARQVLPFLILSWLNSVVLLGGARAAPLIWSSGATGSQLPIMSSGPSAQNKAPQVLVIGGAGYIGSVLVRQLLDKGYQVRVLDKLLYGRGSLVGLYDQPGWELVTDDFRNVEAVVGAMRGVGAVIHLGAIVGDPACALDQDFSIEVNLMATKMIAEVARGAGVRRMIFASTCSVYGASDELLDEKSALCPVSLYAQTKIASEKALLNMQNGEFCPVILRFATVYGASPRPRFDLVVNLLTAKAVCEQNIPIYGGSQWRPFVHVADVARAILCVLEAPQVAVNGEIFNIGSDDQNYQISMLGELIHDCIPSAVITHFGDDTDHRNYRVSFAKCRHRLGFEPLWTIRDGVREVREAIETGQIVNYQSSQYSNYKYLIELHRATSDTITAQAPWPLLRGDLRLAIS